MLRFIQNISMGWKLGRIERQLRTPDPDLKFAFEDLCDLIFGHQALRIVTERHGAKTEILRGVFYSLTQDGNHEAGGLWVPMYALLNPWTLDFILETYALGYSDRIRVLVVKRVSDYIQNKEDGPVKWHTEEQAKQFVDAMLLAQLQDQG